MAAVEWANKVTSGNLAKASTNALPRVVDAIVDFATLTVGTTDHVNVLTLPKGTVVLAAGIEQITVGTASNTLVARVGSVTMSGTLAGDAAVGTVTAHADVTGGAPTILTAAADLNMLSATAARTSGKARVFAVVIETLDPVLPEIADRDQLA